MTEAELAHLKGNFTELAASDTDSESLRDAERELAQVEEQIGEAKDKVAAVADRVEESPKS